MSGRGRNAAGGQQDPPSTSSPRETEEDVGRLLESLKGSPIPTALTNALLTVLEVGPELPAEGLSAIIQAIKTERTIHHHSAVKLPLRSKEDFTRFLGAAEFPRALQTAVKKWHAEVKAKRPPSDPVGFFRAQLQAYHASRPGLKSYTPRDLPLASEAELAPSRGRSAAAARSKPPAAAVPSAGPAADDDGGDGEGERGSREEDDDREEGRGAGNAARDSTGAGKHGGAADDAGDDDDREEVAGPPGGVGEGET